MILSSFPNTEDVSNWTVVVFRCPRKNWTELLRGLYSELDKRRLSFIPNYTIRDSDPSTDSLMISFRILRKRKNEAAIKSLLDSFLKAYEHEVDPKADSPLFRFRAWESTLGWTRDRCEILGRISRFALEIINADTGLNVRLGWAHLFSNMIAIFEWEKAFRSPETPQRVQIVTYH
jgi:hypothetical protein